MSAAAFAWLKEKPQGIYLKADEDHPYLPYTWVKAEQLHWLQLSLFFFFFLWKRERSESVLCSLEQPDMEKPT